MENNKKVRFFFLKLWFVNIIKKLLDIFNKFKIKEKEKFIDDEEDNGWGWFIEC